jgi:hypothetical protein
MTTFSAKQRRQLKDWATRALHGLDESSVFIGIIDDSPMNVARIEFTLQLGYSVLNEKLIVIPVPHGVKVPSKLAAVADRIVRYNPQDLATLQQSITQVLTELGVNKQ